MDFPSHPVSIKGQFQIFDNQKEALKASEKILKKFLNFEKEKFIKNDLIVRIIPRQYIVIREFHSIEDFRKLIFKRE